jgi:hypothetical protein
LLERENHVPPSSVLTEQKNQLASLFAASWKDDTLTAGFMSDPKAVLAEYDLAVPDGMDVKVVENADTCVHITMPAPPSGHMRSRSRCESSL